MESQEINPYEGDQDGKVRECGAHLPLQRHQKCIYMWYKTYGKLNRNWQKDSYTTNAVRKIHT